MTERLETIFRPYSSSDSLRSDRSAGDRLRHRQKVRQAIRENIGDILAEEAIIGQDRSRIIKVPIRGIKEYRFIYGQNEAGVGEGDGEMQPGQVIGQGQPREGDGEGQAGNRPGVDYYETDVTLDELVDIMFEDLELPDLERKALRERLIDKGMVRKGYRPVGIRVHLDKKRTARQRVRRGLATGRGPGSGGAALEESGDDRFRFIKDDLRFRRWVPDQKAESNAVVFCIMDTSGSMDTMKKYLARGFFFLLYQFVRTRYQNVEVRFIAHETTAREVTEEEFFSKGQSGGTCISSGYEKTLEIIHERYDPALWNLYAFHCSDGDNFPSDDDAALKAARELCDVCNLFGYGEIKPYGGRFGGATMLDRLRTLPDDNFQAVLITGKDDVWPSFKALLSKERVAE